MEDVQQICHHNFFVITGGPGVGKTTLLQELEKRNFRCIPEVAREIIKEQMATGGDALPWRDTESYKQLMLERSVERYKQVSNDNTATATFFDRGIPDTLCYATLIHSQITDAMDRYAKHYRYNKKVFILPPWFEIYETDNERKQTWEEAVTTYETMKDTYEQYGYEAIEVPKVSVRERVDFVMDKVGGLK